MTLAVFEFLISHQLSEVFLDGTMCLLLVIINCNYKNKFSSATAICYSFKGVWLEAE